MYHQTYQRMKRINHHRGGAPKVTPFGVKIYGILSKDAHAMLVRLAGIRFPQTDNCLSYLSARQQWIDWWIRIIQKQVSEAVVPGIEAGFAHRATLAGAMTTSPNNTCRSPPVDHCAQAPIVSGHLRRKGRENSIEITSAVESHYPPNTTNMKTKSL